MVFVNFPIKLQQTVVILSANNILDIVVFIDRSMLRV